MQKNTEKINLSKVIHKEKGKNKEYWCRIKNWLNLKRILKKMISELTRK